MRERGPPSWTAKYGNSSWTNRGKIEIRSFSSYLSLSVYYFQLEQSQAKYSSVLQLNFEGTVTDNRKKMSKFCYYSTLYKTKFKEDAMSAFYNYLDSICQEEKLICDSRITIEEIIDAANHLNIIGHLGMMESPLTFINFSLSC